MAGDGGDARVDGNLTGATRAMFRLREPGDLRLRGPVSEAVDRGAPLPAVTADIDGTARLVGATPDLGAHGWRPAGQD